MQTTRFEIPEKMREMADRSVEQAKKAFEQFLNATQKAVATAEGSAKTLRDSAADVNRQALAYIEEFRKRSGIACRVNVDSGDIDLAEDRSIVVFRILQESLTNISRHADARNVEISLRCDATHVRLDIKDDGRGFDAAAVRQKNTFGLLGIRERAIMLHGTLAITSEPGQGTQVSLSIPIRGQ